MMPHSRLMLLTLKLSPGFSTAQSGLSSSRAYSMSLTERTLSPASEGVPEVVLSVALYMNLTRLTVAVMPVAQMEIGRGVTWLGPTTPVRFVVKIGGML